MAFSKKEERQLRRALKDAVVEALGEDGVTAIRKLSMFPSANEPDDSAYIAELEETLILLYNAVCDDDRFANTVQAGKGFHQDSLDSALKVVEVVLSRKGLIAVHGDGDNIVVGRGAETEFSTQNAAV